MEDIEPLSTFLKVLNEISIPRHKFSHFSISGQKMRENDHIFVKKLKNVEIHVLDIVNYFESNCTLMHVANGKIFVSTYPV